MRGFGLVTGGAVSALLLLGSLSLSAQGLAPADAIAQRKAGLRDMQRRMEAIKAAVDGRGDVAALAPSIAGMEAFYRDFPALFPPGSEAGDTKARPEVWSNRAVFETASRNAVGAAENLRKAAASGDAAATGSALQQMGAACGACHRNFRNR